MSTNLQSTASVKRPQFLKVPEVAQLLNVKPRTIYEMVAQHRIPYRKPPGTNILRFDLDEILAWTRGENNK
ncbi:MAG TPA: helix-turn-helix domain-containing protein [Pyrinomonadaceae bacterium]|nr:helix-turn-helix domain-containing protein [Pyrinomonadaceae bacterium]